PPMAEQGRQEYQAKYAVWDAKTKDIRAEMDKLAAPQLARMYQDIFDKFPPEIQDAITTPGDQKTPIQWQMYYKAKPQLSHTIEEASKRLRGEDARRWHELETELANYADLKPAPMPVAQTMIDNGKDSPKTCVLGGGVYDSRKDEV